MYKSKSASCQTCSARTFQDKGSSRYSAFSDVSGVKAAGGDFKPIKRHAVVIYTENKADTPDGEDAEREAILRKIRTVVRDIEEQEKYMKHQEEKQRRNILLMEHLTSLIETDRLEIQQKRAECEQLEAERINYQQIIADIRQEVSTSSSRLNMVKTLNGDLITQKQALEDERVSLYEEDRKRVSMDERTRKYVEAKMFLLRQQEKGENLIKRIKWYEKQINKITSKCDRMETPKANLNFTTVLPQIVTDKANKVSELYSEGLKPDSIKKTKTVLCKEVSIFKAKWNLKQRRPELKSLRTKRFYEKHRLAMYEI